MGSRVGRPPKKKRGSFSKVLFIFLVGLFFTLSTPEVAADGVVARVGVAGGGLIVQHGGHGGHVQNQGVIVQRNEQHVQGGGGLIEHGINRQGIINVQGGGRQIQVQGRDEGRGQVPAGGHGAAQDGNPHNGGHEPTGGNDGGGSGHGGAGGDGAGDGGGGDRGGGGGGGGDGSGGGGGGAIRPADRVNIPARRPPPIPTRQIGLFVNHDQQRYMNEHQMRPLHLDEIHNVQNNPRFQAFVDENEMEIMRRNVDEPLPATRLERNRFYERILDREMNWLFDTTLEANPDHYPPQVVSLLRDHKQNFYAELGLFTDPDDNPDARAYGQTRIDLPLTLVNRQPRIIFRFDRVLLGDSNGPYGRAAQVYRYHTLKHESAHGLVLSEIVNRYLEAARQVHGPELPPHVIRQAWADGVREWGREPNGGHGPRWAEYLYQMFRDDGFSEEEANRMVEANMPPH